MMNDQQRARAQDVLRRLSRTKIRGFDGVERAAASRVAKALGGYVSRTPEALDMDLHVVEMALKREEGRRTTAMRGKPEREMVPSPRQPPATVGWPLVGFLVLLFLAALALLLG